MNTSFIHTTGSMYMTAWIHISLKVIRHTFLHKCCSYMPPINFKHVQEWNMKINLVTNWAIPDPHWVFINHLDNIRNTVHTNMILNTSGKCLSSSLWNASCCVSVLYIELYFRQTQLYTNEPSFIQRAWLSLLVKFCTISQHISAHWAILRRYITILYYWIGTFIDQYLYFHLFAVICTDYMFLP
jgi:hypothetical protein